MYELTKPDTIIMNNHTLNRLPQGGTETLQNIAN